MAARDFDVVLFGATSVTGRRVAEYLAGRAPELGLTWAAAARDPAKCERTLAAYGAEDVETIVADVSDAASLAAMAARARTVENLVGPYMRFGEPVIEACVAERANYVDLTGEIPFVRRIVDRFSDAARDAEVKIVQTCGFEALPPDLGVRLAADAARERYGEPLTEVDLEVAVTHTPSGLPRPSDVLSGGTLQSMAEVAGDPDADRLSDPALLIPDAAEAAAVRARSPIRLAPRRNAAGDVLTPMTPAAFINPAVIHRSAALAAAAAGEPLHPFAYREGVAISGPGPTLPLRYAAAGAISGLQATMARGARSSPAVRRRISAAMRRAFPSSGFGPADDRVEDWAWGMSITARASGGQTLAVRIEGDGHPGYLTTARMLGEAGLALSQPDATPAGGGCLTPAIALGTENADRFARAGLRFVVL